MVYDSIFIWGHELTLTPIFLEAAVLNLSLIVRYHALATPNRIALIYGDDRISYAALDNRISRVAGWLKAQGLGRGDVLAMLMKNSPAFIEIGFAASHLGAVFMPLNYRLAADEVDYICTHAGAKMICVDAELSALVPHALQRLVIDTELQRDASRAAGPAPDCLAPHPVQPDDLFRLMYTSGTTGRPKGVMHSYSNFYWKCVGHDIALDLGRDARLLIVGPLYHVGAYDLPGMAVLWKGGTLVIHRDFDPATIFRSIAAEAVSCAWLAPVMLGALLIEGNSARHDLTSLRWVIGGGERTPESRIHAFGSLFPCARYIDGYGLTESCSGDTLMEAGREISKIGSTGRAIPHLEIRICDDQGQPLPPGATGEICLRGPKVTRGYWKDPEKTASSFFGDWFRTGDVGHLDAEGFLFLSDRKKDMIISGGENIAASEIERVIYERPEIAETAVVGAPDDRWGERPVAFVVAKPGTAIDVETIARHCREKLAAFKCPRDILLRDSLPRNASGKILKRLLRDDIAKMALPQTSVQGNGQ